MTLPPARGQPDVESQQADAVWVGVAWAIESRGLLMGRGDDAWIVGKLYRPLYEESGLGAPEPRSLGRNRHAGVYHRPLSVRSLVTTLQLWAHYKEARALRYHRRAAVFSEDVGRAELPEGVRLLRTLRGHEGDVHGLAWSPDGALLASASKDGTIRLWAAESGDCMRVLAHDGTPMYTVAFHPNGRVLGSGSEDGRLRLWDVSNGRLLRELAMGGSGATLGLAFSRDGALASAGNGLALWAGAENQVFKPLGGDNGTTYGVAFDPAGRVLASGSWWDDSLKLWDVSSGEVLHQFRHARDVNGVAFHPSGGVVASCCDDRAVRLWDVRTGKLLRELEGHTGLVTSVMFLLDGRLLATLGLDRSLRFWDFDTGRALAIVDAFREGPHGSSGYRATMAAHPRRPLVATAIACLAPSEDVSVHLWEFDSRRLSGRPAAPGVAYTTAKIVLVGEPHVGKTGLGWRLAHGEFKEHSPTHGQQFWLLHQLGGTRADGTQCEAILWDLAGQSDYRLIHSLFMDDADLALVLFDPTLEPDPLRGVEYWLRDMRIPAILVAARIDRGEASYTSAEIEAFCSRRGLRGYVATSALTGDGVEQLVARMADVVAWDTRPTTVITNTFKRIKDYVLTLKEADDTEQVIQTPVELRARLEGLDSSWRFTNEEMLTAVGHLANHGFVIQMRTSKGEPRILLAPELLTNLAASFVLEARRNHKGLGSLEEGRLVVAEYHFPELDALSGGDREVLLDATTLLLLEHNVCFREIDPLSSRAYLVFPELINLKRPAINYELPVEDGVAYTVIGSVQNVYASLVVLLGYTGTFTRTSQWWSEARYEVGDGHVCGFRQEAEREGELDFVLYFGTSVGAPIRTLFQSLFESFLARRSLTVQRYVPVLCDRGHQVNRAVVREQVAEGSDCVFCPRCGQRLALPRADASIQLTRELEVDAEAERQAADRRSRLEHALLELKRHVTSQGIAQPACFISYAWGSAEHERWVEKELATDLTKAGITVILDRWENERIGASVPRFVERVDACDRVIVVGTPRYRTKYDNHESMGGFVVAAEGDLIAKRMIGTEARKETVLPVLLDGTDDLSFPPLLQGRVYADFRQAESYPAELLVLLLTLYGLPHLHPVSLQLGRLIRDRE